MMVVVVVAVGVVTVLMVAVENACRDDEVVTEAGVLCARGCHNKRLHNLHPYEYRKRCPNNLL